MGSINLCQPADLFLQPEATQEYPRTTVHGMLCSPDPFFLPTHKRKSGLAM